MALCCHDKKNWKQAPDKTRRGWIRTTCSVCGKWLGYHLPQGAKEK